MNKHLHRLVFDTRRGMRVPAAEHTRGMGKAASGQTRAVRSVAVAVSMLLGGAAVAQDAARGAVSVAGGAPGAANAARMTQTLSATRSVSSMVQQVLQSGRPNLPVFSEAYRWANLGSFDDPTTSTDGMLMTMLQHSGAIVVNFDSFDLGKGYVFQAIQPDGGRALIKVRNADPSLIDGTVKANGELMLENTAGIIFGRNARVDTRSMVATALRIGQAVQNETMSKEDFAKIQNDPLTLNLYRFRKGEAVFGGHEADTQGFVAVENGAVIRSLDGGRVIMVAPRVVNKGLIETPQGQTILAAGKTAYLYAPTDLAQRGLLVAVDNFSEATLEQVKTDVLAASANGETGLNDDAVPLGTVENVRDGGAFASGLVRADKGTINLVGAAIRQKGQLTATTAVKGQNGAIFITAMKDTAASSDLFRIPKTLGTVELGEGSITEVLPSVEGLVLNDKTPEKEATVAATVIEGVVMGDTPDQTAVLTKIGVRPDEVLRVADTPVEPKKPTAPAEEATDDQKAAYLVDLEKYNEAKVKYEAALSLLQQSSDTFYRSRIDVLGQDITLRSGSRVQASAGEVNLIAVEDFSASPFYKSDALPIDGLKDNSSLVMEKGAVVDVSGLDNLLFSPQRMLLDQRLFSLELADSPVQRGGVAYRSQVLADARRSVTLGDVSGYYSNLRYTAAEYSTVGGLARIVSQGQMWLDEGAKVDFSGGALTYDAITNDNPNYALRSSVLLRDGLVTRVEEANRNVRYDSYIADPTQSNAEDVARFGLAAVIGKIATQVPSQFVGKSAGVAVISAPDLAMDAGLDGSVRMSDVQRNSAAVAERDSGLDAMLTKSGLMGPVWPGLGELKGPNREVKLPQALIPGSAGAQPHLFTSLRPTAGLLVLGHESGLETGDVPDRSAQTLVEVRTRVDTLASAIQAGAPALTWQDALAQRSGVTKVSASKLNQAGLAGFTVFAEAFQLGNGQAGDAPTVNLAAGGSFTVKVNDGDALLHGSVTTPGGSIDIKSLKGNVTLTGVSTLQAGGSRGDERFVGTGVAPALKGGTVKLTAGDQLTLAQGSLVDVSGAAWQPLGGSLIKGNAGSITLKANLAASSQSDTLPNGNIDLQGTLSGFDFAAGGTLNILGLPTVVLGGTREGAFTLSDSLYADRGFGTVKVESLGDFEVLANTKVKPQLVNMVALPSRLSAFNGKTFALSTLEAGLRNGLNWSFSATTEPNVDVQNGQPLGANLTVGTGVDLDAGLGGSISLAAGGSIEMAGTLQTAGGTVSLAILGARGVTNKDDLEAYGYVKDQGIHLADQSVIDVSGAFKGVDTPAAFGLASRKVGEVLAGGTVNLGLQEEGKAVRGRIEMDAGATIRLNGASAEVDRDRAAGKIKVSSAAGTMNIKSTDGFSLLGNIEAKALDASVAGGTVNVILSREGTYDKPNSKFDTDTQKVVTFAYPGNEGYEGEELGGLRTIRITDTNQSATDLELRHGEGLMSAQTLNTSGFDRIMLRADEAVQLNEGVNLMADATRTRLQSVVIDAPVLEVTDSATHTIQAHHVAFGPITRSQGGTPGTALASERTLSGTGTLDVEAGLIEVVGNTAVQGVNSLNLNATLSGTAQAAFNRLDGEVRFIGQRQQTNATLTNRTLEGQLSYNGALNIKAGQTYATTLSNVLVKGFKDVQGNKDSVLTVEAPEGGSTSQTPLSALATLRLQARDVKLDGTIRQPVGTIEVLDAEKLTLTDRTMLSVSADGTAVPVGRLLNGTQWLYAPDGDNGIPTGDNAVQDITKLPVRKQIILNGKTVELTAKSTAEAQAGGDIVGWQFNPGVGGSTDTYLRPDVFAVLPGYNYDFAPFDADIRAGASKQGSDLRAGDKVTVSTGNGVLATGTYTLLDPRYGILPGAVLVSATQLATTNALTNPITNDDGSVIVSGYRTATGTAQNGGNDKRLALVLEPQATYGAKSEVVVTSGNAFVSDRAKREGITLTRPGDAGRVSLAAENAFDWRARFNLNGDGDLKAGEFDLAMPTLTVQNVQSVLRAGATQNADLGNVSLAELNALGAESVMLGGQRTTLADGSIGVKRKAKSVVFKAAVDEQGQLLTGEASTFSTDGELWAVAAENVRVDDGLTIASKGADTGAAHTYKVEGDGALLRVGHLAKSDVQVIGASGNFDAALTVGSVEAGAAGTTLRGNAVQFDSTGALALGQGVVLSADAVSLGAGQVVVGEAVGKVDEDEAPTNALVLKGDFLERLNQANQLTLRAFSGMTFAQGSQLGGDATERITLDAPQLKGVARADAGSESATDTVQVTARELLLRNTSGKAAPRTDDDEAESGVGKLVLSAKPVLTDGRTGGITFDATGTGGQRLAFDGVTAQSQGDIVFGGKGRTEAQGGVTLNADRVTTRGDADQQLVAGHDLTINRAAGGKTLNESLGAGGKLALEGRVLTQAGNIDMEAGRLDLVARGAATDATALAFAEGSRTSVAGRLKKVSDTYAVASGGGSITAVAQQGHLVVDGELSAAAPVLPADMSGEAPYAGSITLRATAAGARVEVGEKALIDLSGAMGRTGQIKVDAAGLALTAKAQAAASDNAALAQTGLGKLVEISRLANGQALGAFSVRQREEGSLDLDTQVKAALVALTADKGHISMGGQAVIDATVPAGGVVQLQARDDLILNDGARIEARSTREGANGGDVLLSSSQGTVRLGDASVVADSEGDAQDGRILIRAKQTQDAKGAYTGGMNVARLSDASQPLMQAGRVELEGVRVYDDARLTTLGTGTASTTNLNLAALTSAASTFAGKQTSILAQAGLSATPNASVRAGAEIRATGNFSIANDLQLSAGAQPMNLTVRAAGDLSVNGNVSAGFSLATNTGAVQAGQGASLRFVAGADMASADVNATQADAGKGHFTLASGKFIRTTTGSMDVHASGDVRLMAATPQTPSAIYVAGGLSNLAANELFQFDASQQAKTSANTAYVTNGKAVFTERGGRLNVSAGAEVGSFKSVTTNLNGVVVERTRQALTQLTGNYFYHGGNPNAMLAAQRLPVAWWSGLNDFRQGFGSFGGGNIDIKAGGSVGDVAVVAPTNARAVIKLNDAGAVASREFKVLNGGDVNVSAEGDIFGGVYFLGRGEGHISSGGSLLAGSDLLASGALPKQGDVSEPDAMLALMDGHWSVDAVNDLTVSHVYNPTIVPFSSAVTAFNVTGTPSTNMNANQASVYFTYASDAGVSLNALRGDVVLSPNSQNFNRMHANSPVGKLDLTLTNGKDASVAASVLPPVVHATSLNGDVMLDTAGWFVDGTGRSSNGQGGSSLYVMPSVLSDVSFYAANDVRLQANLQLLDVAQAQLGLPDTDNPALLSAPTQSGNLLTTFSNLTFNLGALGGSTKPSEANAFGVDQDLGALIATPISDLSLADNDNLARIHAGNDILFESQNDAGMGVTPFLRSARPLEMVAGRDIVAPNFIGQNFDEADVTRLVAGRDIIATNSALVEGVLALSGPGQFKIEAGRDLTLQQMTGVLALGNKLNQALPEASAKITLMAGAAKAINTSELLARHGQDPALRSAMAQAMQDSRLPVPEGFASWLEVPEAQAQLAFEGLAPTRQVQAVDDYLNATFAAAYMPEEAGQSAAYYRSEAFQRKKYEAMWREVTALTGQAVEIAISSNAAEEALRVQRRKALYDQAEAVAELAGLGQSFTREGNIDVGRSRVHNLGSGGGTTLGQVDDSLGGIDVLTPGGQVFAGLPNAVSSNVLSTNGGFYNANGGSFRSLSSLDFLAGDQKVIVSGRGNLLIYTTQGSIDSGKGSNTAAATSTASRQFNPLTGQVETKGEPPTSGSGFQQILSPADVKPVLGLYAPNGEIRALDAFIKGGNVQVGAQVVKGADNIGGAAGLAPPPAPPVSVNLTPKVADTAAGVSQVADAGDAKSKAQAANAVLSVELLGFGDPGAGASPGEPVSERGNTGQLEEERKQKPDKP